VNFTETNLFGVYVAPISLMLVAAWIVTIALRRIAARFGLLRYVWHPALFVFAIYLIMLSSMVLLAGAEDGQPKVDIRKSEKL
jgi:protein AaeX